MCVYVIYWITGKLVNALSWGYGWCKGLDSHLRAIFLYDLLLLYGAVLHARLEPLEQGTHLRLDNDPVEPEHDCQEGGGEDDEDREKTWGDGMAGALSLHHLPDGGTVKLLNVLDPPPCVIEGEAVVTPHLILVDEPGGGGW